MRVGQKNSIKSFTLTSATVILLSLAFTTSQSRAEFLDDLFGDDTPAPSRAVRGDGVSQSYSRYGNKADKAAATRKRKKTAIKVDADPTDEDEAADKKQKEVKFDLCTEQTAHRADVQKADAYLYDKDLKNGDSVMTPNGVLVFKGRSGCPHKPEEFVALSATNAPKNSKKALTTIDAAAKTNWK